MNSKEQGVNSGIIFHGKAPVKAVRLAYGESTELFAKAIHSNLEITKKKYVLADFGSGKGEFLRDLLGVLLEYKFKTIAIDVNVDDMTFNVANQKIISNLSKIELQDKTVDVALVRYVLAWNNLDEQQKIISEIKRITKGIAIIQHQGAMEKFPKKLQNASKILFSGIVPKLKRNDFFFSTSKQIEQIMKNLEIDFERIQNRKIENLSSIFIEKYRLSKDDSNNVRKILEGSDVVKQSAWILKFKQY